MTFKFTSVTLTFPLRSRLQIHVIHISNSCCSVIQSCLTSCDPMNCAMQASMSFTISQSLLKLMSIESLMPSNYLILCHPLLLLPSIFSTIRAFSHESALCITWPKYWSFSINPSNEYSELICFRIDWFDFLAVRGTFKSLLQHHSCITESISLHTHTHILRAWRRKSKLLLQNQMIGSRLGLVVRGFGLWIWPQLLSTCLPDLMPQSFLKFVF